MIDFFVRANEGFLRSFRRRWLESRTHGITEDAFFADRYASPLHFPSAIGEAKTAMKTIILPFRHCEFQDHIAFKG
jgi:hypothetical protein